MYVYIPYKNADLHHLKSYTIEDSADAASNTLRCFCGAKGHCFNTLRKREQIPGAQTTSSISTWWTRGHKSRVENGWKTKEPNRLVILAVILSKYRSHLQTESTRRVQKLAPLRRSTSTRSLSLIHHLGASPETKDSIAPHIKIAPHCPSFLLLGKTWWNFLRCMELKKLPPCEG